MLHNTDIDVIKCLHAITSSTRLTQHNNLLNLARRKNLLAFACLFTFYACLFIFCACLFTFFLGANHKAPTFHVTVW